MGKKDSEQANVISAYIELQDELQRLQQNMPNKTAQKRIETIQDELNQLRTTLNIVVRYRTPDESHQAHLKSRGLLQNEVRRLETKFDQISKKIAADLVTIQTELEKNGCGDLTEYATKFASAHEQEKKSRLPISILRHEIDVLEKKLNGTHIAMSQLYVPFSAEKKKLMAESTLLKQGIKIKNRKLNELDSKQAALWIKQFTMNQTLQIFKELPEQYQSLDLIQENIARIQDDILNINVIIQESADHCKDIGKLCEECKLLFDEAYSITHSFYKENIVRMREGASPLVKSDMMLRSSAERDLLGAIITHLSNPSSATVNTVLQRFKGYCEINLSLLDVKANIRIERVLETFARLDPKTTARMDLISINRTALEKIDDPIPFLKKIR